MADERQLKIILIGDRGGWAKAQEELRNSDQVADLRGADLTECVLNEFDFEDTNFEQATLAGVNLNGANLMNANLNRASLAGANLDHANFSGASLIDANLDGAMLRDAILDESKLNGANFRNARLEKALLRRSDLRNAVLERAELTGAELQEANLDTANLARANFTGAILINANLNNTNLAGANFQDANLNGTELRNANLDGTNFNDAQMEDATLKGAKITKGTHGLDNLTVKQFDELRVVNPGVAVASDPHLEPVSTIEEGDTNQTEHEAAGALTVGSARCIVDPALQVLQSLGIPNDISEEHRDLFNHLLNTVAELQMKLAAIEEENRILSSENEEFRILITPALPLWKRAWEDFVLKSSGEIGISVGKASVFMAGFVAGRLYDTFSSVGPGINV